MQVSWQKAAAFTAAALITHSVANAQTLTTDLHLMPTDDPVLYWNQVMTTGTTALSGAPPVVARNSALMNIAIFDAVNSALGLPNVPFLTGVSAPGGDTRAAASQAAHDVLVFLNPAKRPEYDAALAASLAPIADPAAAAAGASTGSAYASAILAARAGDGSSSAATTPYTPGSDPGDWTPTSDTPFILPGWGNVSPFLLSSGDQFRPGAPPALNSVEYANAFNEVKEIGSATSTTRTQDQKDAAIFWQTAGGASWIKMTVGLALDEGLTTLGNAQLFSLLSATLNDSFVSVYGAEYDYGFWRPITAIRSGDLDGNPLTIADPSWMSLLAAPNHPSFPSAHATADGAAAAVLLGTIGDEPFCATFGEINRCWGSIAQASAEGANSRIWGGIHYDFDRTNGLDLGGRIGRFALAQSTFSATPEPATWAMMLIGFGVIGGAMRRKKATSIQGRMHWV